MKNKKLVELNPKERWEVMDEYWDSIGKFTGYDINQYRSWLDKNGIATSDLSAAEFHEIIDGDEDVCCIYDDDDDEDENDSAEIGVDSIETREEAAEWLDSMTEKYGNTYFFPDDVKGDLDSLIDRFGSTYHWCN